MKPKTKLKTNITSKSFQIDKTQSTMLSVVVVATIITVFCLMSFKALVSQGMYQRRVINARHQSAQQLNKDIGDANTLVNQYNSVFLGNNAQNVIGGTNESNANASPPNGDNGKIVLDALPTTYDFPALLTSLSSLLNNDGLGTQSIGGSDQSSTVSSQPTTQPKPGNIDVTISGTGTYSGTEKLIKDLERSIRPFNITHLTLTGDESSLTASINVTTYYQPATTLNITSQEIK